MGLKRKRSGSSLGLSPSSSSGFTSSSSSSPQPFGGFGDAMMEDLAMGDAVPAYDLGAWPATYAESTHLNSRTRKRFRDNRPDEHTIYEHTFQRLYQAQRADFQAPTPALPRPASSSSTSHRQHAQASLHSFWTLPNRPSTSSAAAAPPATGFGSFADRGRCEDCDADMDVGWDGGAAASCVACGRSVCDMCSVGGAGAASHRECLGCRTRPRGPGWDAGGVLAGAGLSCSGCGATLAF